MAEVFSDCRKLSDTLLGGVWRAKQTSTNRNVVFKTSNLTLHARSQVVMNGVKYHLAEDIMAERDILRHLSSQKTVDSQMRIVRYVDFLFSAESYCLVMEDGGHSLHSFSQRAHAHLLGGRLEMSEWHRMAKVIFEQMVGAIEFIHAHSVCHYDVSLCNFCINDVAILSKQSQISFLGAVNVKLCDFGLATIDDGRSKSRKFVGKPMYWSPEIQQRQSFDPRSNDVWSLGLSLFVLVVGIYPFAVPSESDAAFVAIMTGQLRTFLMERGRFGYVDEDLLDLFAMFFRFETYRANLFSIKRCRWLASPDVSLSIGPLSVPYLNLSPTLSASVSPSKSPQYSTGSPSSASSSTHFPF